MSSSLPPLSLPGDQPSREPSLLSWLSRAARSDRGHPEAEPGHTPSPGPAPRRERSCWQAASQASTYTLQRLCPRPGESTSGSLEQGTQAPPLCPTRRPHFRPGQAFSGCLLPVCCRLCVCFLGRPRPRPGVLAPLTRAPWPTPRRESLRGSERPCRASLRAAWAEACRSESAQTCSACPELRRGRRSCPGMGRPGSAQRWAAAACQWGCGLLALLLVAPRPGGASEITFELPDNAKQCFYEDITHGTKCTLEFQVITGGHYDVDCRLEDPDGTVLYKEMKKQYDSFTFTASKNGTYKFCFSNEFSTFTHKTVYFDFQVGEDPPLFPSENRVSALTQMESACVSIHEALKSVIDYQTHFRLREAQGRSRAEDLNTRVAYWSVGEALILLVVSIGQVFLLKSFFSDKRTTTTRVGS